MILRDIPFYLPFHSEEIEEVHPEYEWRLLNEPQTEIFTGQFLVMFHAEIAATSKKTLIEVALATNIENIIEGSARRWMSTLRGEPDHGVFQTIVLMTSVELDSQPICATMRHLEYHNEPSPIYFGRRSILVIPLVDYTMEPM